MSSEPPPQSGIDLSGVFTGVDRDQDILDLLAIMERLVPREPASVVRVMIDTMRFAVEARKASQ